MTPPTHPSTRWPTPLGGRKEIVLMYNIIPYCSLSKNQAKTQTQGIQFSDSLFWIFMKSMNDRMIE